jgi:pterin-4a-carbinolamine dehydratase
LAWQRFCERMLKSSTIRTTSVRSVEFLPDRVEHHPRICLEVSSVYLSLRNRD